MKKPNGYWTKERCHEEALKYNRRVDFHKESKSAYSKAFKSGWLDDICSHMNTKKSRKITKELCYEVSSGYTNKSEFIVKEPNIYTVIIKNGWLDAFDHMIRKIKPNGYWTKEVIHKEALKYKTRMEFKNGSMGAYVQAVKRGYLNDVCKHMDIIGNLKLRHLYIFEFNDNHFYVGLSLDPNKRYQGHMSNSSKYISPVLQHIKETNTNFTFRVITKHPLDVITAGEKEMELIKSYCNAGWVKLNKSNGGEFGGNKIHHTKETIHKEALKYNRRVDFKKGCSGGYKIACKNGWLNDVCSHMLKSRECNIKWGKDEILAATRLYANVADFKKYNSYAYKKACQNNWLKEIKFAQ
jgi:hypothetical protein